MKVVTGDKREILLNVFSRPEEIGLWIIQKSRRASFSFNKVFEKFPPMVFFPLVGKEHSKSRDRIDCSSFEKWFQQRSQHVTFQFSRNVLRGTTSLSAIRSTARVQLYSQDALRTPPDHSLNVWNIVSNIITHCSTYFPFVCTLFMRKYFTFNIYTGCSRSSDTTGLYTWKEKHISKKK